MAVEDKAVEESRKDENPGFFRRTRLYLLEYVLYHSFLIVLLSYIAYTIYALFWVIAGKDLNSGLVEASVWFMAGSFVFIPLTYIVYTRTRWEEVRHTARLKQGLRVAITYTQLIIGLMAGITFALIMFINLIRFIVGLTDGSSLLTLVLPSAIMTGITAMVVFDILSKKSRRGLTIFRPIFFGICILASIILLVLTAVFGRSGAYDRQTMKDLVAITESIKDEYSYGEEIDSDLSKLDLPEGVAERAAERGYEIKPVSSPTSSFSSRFDRGYYDLCATFKNSNSGSYDSNYRLPYLSVNQAHPAGHYCFELTS